MLVLQKVPGKYLMREVEVTGGGGGAAIEPLTQTLTAAVNGTTFSKAGTYTDVESIISVTPDGYFGQAGVEVVSSSGGNTTFMLTLPGGLDPITGSITFRPI